jgi:hypothetical protein
VLELTTGLNLVLTNVYAGLTLRESCMTFIAKSFDQGSLISHIAMSVSTRIPIVEFRSLLSPPMRIPLRALQSLYRPRCLPTRSGAACSQPCLEQRRNLVLWKTAKAKTVLGMHKVLPFSRYEVAPRNKSEQRVTIVDGDKVIAQDITLETLYDEHVQPGQILYLNEDIGKSRAENITRLREEKANIYHRTYGIVTAESIPGNRKDSQKGKGKGALRVTPVTLGSPMQYFKVAMDRSYQFIKHGSPVEFGIRISGKYEKAKEEKLTPVDLSSWQWIHEHFPHLRPDFILRSMPENSRFLVDPVTDGRIIQFVIAAPPFPSLENVTHRLFAVKKSVQKSITQGKQAQLPKWYRSQLQTAGHGAYSAASGVPLPDDAQTEASEEQSETAGEAQLSDSKEDRYMMETSKAAGGLRFDKLSPSGGLIKSFQRSNEESLRDKQKWKKKNRRTWTDLNYPKEGQKQWK